MEQGSESKAINQAILELNQEAEGELNINCTVQKIKPSKKPVNLNNPRERLKRRSQILLAQEQQKIAEGKIKKIVTELEDNKSKKNLEGEVINCGDENKNNNPVKETQKDEKLITLEEKIIPQKEEAKTDEEKIEQQKKEEEKTNEEKIIPQKEEAKINEEKIIPQKNEEEKNNEENIEQNNEEKKIMKK